MVKTPGISATKKNGHKRQRKTAIKATAVRERICHQEKRHAGFGLLYPLSVLYPRQLSSSPRATPEEEIISSSILRGLRAILMACAPADGGDPNGSPRAESPTGGDDLVCGEGTDSIGGPVGLGSSGASTSPSSTGGGGGGYIPLTPPAHPTAHPSKPNGSKPTRALFTRPPPGGSQRSLTRSELKRKFSTFSREAHERSDAAPLNARAHIAITDIGIHDTRPEARPAGPASTHSGPLAGPAR